MQFLPLRSEVLRGKDQAEWGGHSTQSTPYCRRQNYQLGCRLGSKQQIGEPYLLCLGRLQNWSHTSKQTIHTVRVRHWRPTVPASSLDGPARIQVQTDSIFVKNCSRLPGSTCHCLPTNCFVQKQFKWKGLDFFISFFFFVYLEKCNLSAFWLVNTTRGGLNRRKRKTRKTN